MIVIDTTGGYHEHLYQNIVINQGQVIATVFQRKSRIIRK
jgi:hypothetical protein